MTRLKILPLRGRGAAAGGGGVFPPTVAPLRQPLRACHVPLQGRI